MEQDEDAVAATQVVEFVRDDEHRDTVLTGAVHAGQQGLLGLHVDACGRVDQHEQAGVGGEGAGHDDLLRVAAGQVGDGLVGALGVDVEAFDEGGGEVALACAADEAEAAEPVEDAHGGVVADGHAGDEALVVPVAGHARDTGLQRGPHVAEGQRCAVEPGGPAGRRVQPGEGLGEFHLATAADPGESDDLAAADGQVDVLVRR